MLKVKTPTPPKERLWIRRHWFLAFLLALAIASFVASIFGFKVPKILAAPIPVSYGQTYSPAYCKASTDFQNSYPTAPVERDASSSPLLDNPFYFHSDYFSFNGVSTLSCSIGTRVYVGFGAILAQANQEIQDTLQGATEVTITIQHTFQTDVNALSANVELADMSQAIINDYGDLIKGDVTVDSLDYVCDDIACAVNLTLFVQNMIVSSSPYNYIDFRCISSCGNTPDFSNQPYMFSIAPGMEVPVQMSWFIEPGLHHPTKPEPPSHIENIDQWLRDDDRDGLYDSINGIDLEAIKMPLTDDFAGFFTTIINGIQQLNPAGKTCWTTLQSGQGGLLSAYVDTNSHYTPPQTSIMGKEFTFPCVRQLVGRLQDTVSGTSVASTNAIILAVNVPLIAMLIFSLWRDVLLIFTLRTHEKDTHTGGKG